MIALSVLVVIYYLDEVYPPFYSLLSSVEIYMHAWYPMAELRAFQGGRGAMPPPPIRKNPEEFFFGG